jgi:hypothetical protein
MNGQGNGFHCFLSMWGGLGVVVEHYFLSILILARMLGIHVEAYFTESLKDDSTSTIIEIRSSEPTIIYSTF